MSVATRTRAPEKTGAEGDPHQRNHDKSACGIAAIAARRPEDADKVIPRIRICAKRVSHRGAGVGKRGAGAGVLVELDPEHDLEGMATRPGEQYGVVAMYLDENHPQAEAAVEKAVANQGLRFVGWRTPRTHTPALSKYAAQTRPHIRHAVFALKPPTPFGWLLAFLTGMFALLLNKVRGWQSHSDPLEGRAFLLKKEIERAFIDMRYGGSDHGPEKRKSQYPFLLSCSFRCVVFTVLGNGRTLFAFYPDLIKRKSRTAIFHVRYPTNTLPEWCRAHPWEFFVHNGEINTERGNLRWWAGRAVRFLSRKMFPVTNPDRSDSGHLAEVANLLANNGMSWDEAMRLLVPPAYLTNAKYKHPSKADVVAMYEHWKTKCEPWEGPLGGVFLVANQVEPLMFADVLRGRRRYRGARLCGMVDRSGLRPLVIEADDTFVSYVSESGVANFAHPLKTSRPVLRGEMWGYDVESNTLRSNDELEAEFAARAPYAKLVDKREVPTEGMPACTPQLATLPKRLARSGCYADELHRIVGDQTRKAHEAHTGMGDTRPLWSYRFFSNPQTPTSVSDALRHGFAHATRPSIDGTQQADVFELGLDLGPKGSPFRRDKTSALLSIPSPIVSAQQLAGIRSYFRTVVLRSVFDTNKPMFTMRDRAREIVAEAVQAARRGARCIVLSDVPGNENEQSIPLAVVVPMVHNALMKSGARFSLALGCQTVEVRDAHEALCLLSYGAEFVAPELIEETIRFAPELLHKEGKVEDKDTGDQRWARWLKGMDKSIRLIIGRMGSTPLASVIGAELLFPEGFTREFMTEVFPSRAHYVSTELIGWEQLETNYRRMHEAGSALGSSYTRPTDTTRRNKSPLPSNGRLKPTRGAQAQTHLWSSDVIAGINQWSLANGSPDKYDAGKSKLNDALAKLAPITPRDFYVPKFLTEANWLPSARVMSPFEINQYCQFMVPISLGAQPLEPWLHTTMGARRAGAVAHSGEGGVPPWLFGNPLRPNAVQRASGCFSWLLRNLADPEVDIICIKVTQIVKAGMGGVLSGAKVFGLIAEIRGCKTGQGAFSPANMLDVNSIEDLAWLVRLLRCANPHAAIEIKLGSTEDFAPIVYCCLEMLNRAGNPKPRPGRPYYRNRLYFQGRGGGTGNAPFSSRDHTGVSWEEGLREAVEIAAKSGYLALDGKEKDGIPLGVDFFVDGGCRSAYCLYFAWIMGATGIGYGTAALAADRCKYCCDCHDGECPTGQAAAGNHGHLIDVYLRQSVNGSVTSFFDHNAREAHEMMRRSGVEHPRDLRFRFDLLEPRDVEKFGMQIPASLQRLTQPIEIVVDEELVNEHGCYSDAEADNRAFNLIERALDDGAESVDVDAGELSPSDAPFGARLCYRLLQRLGQPETWPAITVRTHGSAPQSYGALTCGKDFTLIHTGYVNGMAGSGSGDGATIIINQVPGQRPDGNLAGGHCIGYGAQAGGTVYVGGANTNYFSACNRGANLLTETTADYACYGMSSGLVFVMGAPGGTECPAGNMFGSGMTGGDALVFDPTHTFLGNISTAHAKAQLVTDTVLIEQAREMVRAYATRSGDAHAHHVLAHFDEMVPHLYHVTSATAPVEIALTVATRRSTLVPEHIGTIVPLPMVE